MSKENDYQQGFDDGLEAGRAIANQMYQDGLSRNPLPKIVQWNIDRRLDVIFPDDSTVIYCKLEEMFEFLGINKCFKDPKRFKALVNKYKTYFLEEAMAMDAHATIEEKIDALNDDTVFNTGFIHRYGYNPTLTLHETVLEIESRVGDFDTVSGKWVKDKSVEAQAIWYTARYERCLN